VTVVSHVDSPTGRVNSPTWYGKLEPVEALLRVHLGHVTVVSHVDSPTGRVNSPTWYGKLEPVEALLRVHLGHVRVVSHVTALYWRRGRVHNQKEFAE
jgi:hypothetical protein